MLERLKKETLNNETEYDRKMARSSIRRNILKEYTGRERPIMLRGEAAENDFSFNRLIIQEVSTLFYCIDNAKPNYYSKNSAKGMVKLLNKYKPFFKGHPFQYQQLLSAMNVYKSY